MNAETIGYNCSRAEWETLRLLLKLPLPPGMSLLELDAQACQAAYDTLCESGLLVPSGDRVVVDRLFAFLLSELSESRLCLRVQADGRHLLLYRTPRLALLCECTLAHCCMIPFQEARQAEDSLQSRLRHCEPPVVVSLLEEDALLETAEAESQDQASTIAAGMFQRFCDLNDKR